VQKITDLGNIPTGQDVVWIDLHKPTAIEVDAVERAFNVEFLTRQEQEEIETSSRYIETEESLIANSNFLQAQRENYEELAVTFILREDVLFTYREGDLKTFAEMVKKIKNSKVPYSTPSQILISIFETRIDQDADMIENMSREITNIGKQMSFTKDLSEDVLLRITRLQETTMMIRENIIDKQRVVSAMLKSDWFEKHEFEKIRIIIKDIGSLLEHTAFNFERLEYLQNTFLGLVNIEQNKIIKIFTVASVVFMPPTLIASIYGMNFRILPELEWSWGYPFALALMAGSSFITLFLFRKKKWL
jgi:magnesium transporter